MSQYWAKLGLNPPKVIRCRVCDKAIPNALSKITQREIDEGESIAVVPAPMCHFCLTDKLEAIGVLKSWQKRGRIQTLTETKPTPKKTSKPKKVIPKPKNINLEPTPTPEKSERNHKKSLGSFL